jgi:hypothetical protein
MIFLISESGRARRPWETFHHLVPESGGTFKIPRTPAGAEGKRDNIGRWLQ